MKKKKKKNLIQFYVLSLEPRCFDLSIFRPTQVAQSSSLRFLCDNCLCCPIIYVDCVPSLDPRGLATMPQSNIKLAHTDNDVTYGLPDDVISPKARNLTRFLVNDDVTSGFPSTTSGQARKQAIFTNSRLYWGVEPQTQGYLRQYLTN